MTFRYYSSVAPETTLTGTINSSATSITVGSTLGFPGLFPYTLALDYEGLTEELVQVDSAAGLSLTVVRAIDGTSAASHTAGARVRHVSSARDFADSRTHENSDEGVHGLGPTEEIVGTDKVQTLTNKTLVSPEVTGTITGSPGFSGTLTGTSAATARIRLDNASDVSPTSTDHAFQVGPDASTNVRIDGNEIMAANNGATSPLGLQSDGGVTTVNSALAADNTSLGLQVNGQIDTNNVEVARTSATSLALQFKATADTQYRFTSLANGLLEWGPGGVNAKDVSLGRSGLGALALTGDLFISNNLGVSNIATMNTLNVTNLTPGGLAITSGSLLTSSAGWSINAVSAGILKAGFMTVNMNFQRTGANITTDGSGTLSTGGVQMGTINLTYAPHSSLNTMYTHAGNTAGVGTAQIVPSTGAVSLVKWSPSSTIATGNIVTVALTYSIN